MVAKRKLLIETSATKTFEQSMAELERVVRELESGELTLDQSLASFERGIALSRECEQKLEEAKGRVEQLLTTVSGEKKMVSFDVKEPS